MNKYIYDPRDFEDPRKEDTIAYSKKMNQELRAQKEWEEIRALKDKLNEDTISQTAYEKQMSIIIERYAI